jgi:phosphoribosylformimino-5-aminoimidazole carboxamide ribotide isomerase
MKFRPCIDIHEGKVKQIVGGTLTDKGAVENYVSPHDADYYAAIYRKDSFPGGHVIMLGQGNREQAIRALNSWPGGLQIGGGINPDNAEEYLETGASHVIVTSYVFADGKINYDNLAKLVKKVGKEKIVLDLSCRFRNGQYYVVTDRWQKFTDFTVSRENIKQLEKYCDEFLVHAADVEGKREGVDRTLIEILSHVTDLPVTYAGGVRNTEDLDEVFNAGKGRVDVTIGSALDLFGGDLPYNEVKKLFRTKFV